MRTRLPMLAGLALLLLPLRAQAQWSLRVAVEAPLYSHTSVAGQSSSFGIHESFQPTLDLLGSYFFADTLSIDLEFRRGLAATGTGYSRQLTYLGPGVTLDVPTFPLYGRAALPIQIEDSAVVFLRLGGGLKIIDLAVFRLYFEVTADFPLAGSGVSFFGSQTFSAGLGAWLKL